MTHRYPDLPDFCWSGPVFFLGLTGGIGAGKSSAAQAFQESGALVYDADELARTALESPELRSDLRELFSDHPEIEGEGELDRKAIAGLVFQSPGLLASLSALIHPVVQRKLRQLLNEAPEGSICVYDVPLLFEATEPSVFDAILVITAPLELRLERVQSRSGWSRREFFDREARQIPLSKKEKMADLVIENTRGPEYLKDAIGVVFEAIRSSRPPS